MDNLSIVVGSTWEQGFVRFSQFYKVYVQSTPEFRRFPQDLDNLFVKNDKGEMVPYSAFMKLRKLQGLNEINRYNLYPTAIIQGAAADGLQQRSGHRRDQRSRRSRRCPMAYDIGWAGPVLRRSEQAGNDGDLYLLDRRRCSCISFWSGSTRASSCRWR